MGDAGEDYVCSEDCEWCSEGCSKAAAVHRRVRSVPPERRPATKRQQPSRATWKSTEQAETGSVVRFGFPVSSDVVVDGIRSVPKCLYCGISPIIIWRCASIPCIIEGDLTIPHYHAKCTECGTRWIHIERINHASSSGLQDHSSGQHDKL